MELLEYPRPGPLGQPAPDRGCRATAKLASWQHPPWDGGAGHVHDRGKAVAVGDGAPTATPPGPRGSRQEGSTIAHSLAGTSSSTRAGLARDHAIDPQRSETTSYVHITVLIQDYAGSHRPGSQARSTLLDGLRSVATCANAGPHSGDREIHGKDGVAGSIPAGGSTQALTSANAGQLGVWGRLNRRCWSSWHSKWGWTGAGWMENTSLVNHSGSGGAPQGPCPSAASCDEGRSFSGR
jgi:hypothetical protein